MIFTRNLITNFIPQFYKVSDHEFVTIVNALGMEIESISKYDIPTNCVVGKIISLDPIEHTHLTLCNVQIQKNKIVKIVCGAKNLIADKKVVVALPGARLNGQLINIKNIKGIDSYGMMCSYSELTGSDQYLPEDEKEEIVMFDDGEIGSNDWIKIIGLDDTIYDISTPANRNDENSYLVFCFEVANKLDLKFNFDLKEINLKKLEGNFDASLVADKKNCNFLCFLDYAIDNIYLQKSIWAIKSVLINHKIRPINYLLDKMNYFSLLTNCPIHVYDANKLINPLVCRLVDKPQDFMALDNQHYQINENDIAIYDGLKPVCLASVIGSNDSKLTNLTKNVKIEIGNFNFVNIRNTAIRLNLDSLASKRASKPLSNYLNLLTVELIKKFLGKPSNLKIYINPNWFTKLIKLGYKELHTFIFPKLSYFFVTKSLKKLGFKTSYLKRFYFKTPQWRIDVVTQQDLLEEIVKIMDVNKLQTIAINDELLPLQDNTEYDIKQKIKDVLLNNYFYEVKTYNLTSKDKINKFNIFDLSSPLEIQTYNLNRKYFRLSLIDHMLKVYQYNNARKLDLMPIFEIQNIFTTNLKTTNLTCLSNDQLFIDKASNCLIPINLNYFKNVLKNIGDILNVKFEFALGHKIDFYDNECLSIIANNKVIGYMGKIKNSCLHDYDLDKRNIYCLSININELIDNFKKITFKINSFGPYQRLYKDIDIALENSNCELISYRLNSIKKISGIVECEIISIYQKNNMTIFTVRYYLDDSKQYSSADLDLIAKEIDLIIK